MRIHVSPNAGSTIIQTVKVHEGGTGGATSVAALSSLNAIPASSLNQPNGIAALDASGKMVSAFFSQDDLPSVSLIGPRTALAGSMVVYQITNFDAFIDYNISTTRGVIVREGDQITYFTPSEAGEAGFVINNRSFQITLSVSEIQTPTIFASDTGTGPTASILYASSEFNRPNTNDTHLNSDWQVASDMGFNTIVAQSMVDAQNLTSRIFTGLALNTIYHARVRHRSSGGALSAWSPVVTFNTRVNNIPDTQTPSLTGADSGLGSSVTIVYNGGVFSRPETSDTHLSSDWQVATDAGFTTIVAQSLNDTVNLRTRSFTGLALNTTYHARLRYRSSGGSESQWSVTNTITTRASYAISIEEAKLLASDRTANDRMGHVVSMSGDANYVAVAATYDDTSTGSVYVYVRVNNGWTQQAKLTASDRATNHFFGVAVSVTADGSRVVVGARGNDGNTGSVYVYVRSGSTWTQEAKLTASDRVGGDQFGISVSVTSDGTRIVAGANGDDAGAGSAYIFIRSGNSWTQEAKIVASDRANADNFGIPAYISGDGTRIAVGAWGDDSNSGSVYVYVRSGSTWTQEAKLRTTDQVTGDQFGHSISMSENASRLAASSFADDNISGSTYVFVRSGSTWTQEAKLTSAVRGQFRYFGTSLSMNADGSRVISGAPGEDTFRGSAYIHVRSGSIWTQESRLIASDRAESDLFGWSVSISSDGSRVLIGAENDDSATGSAYVYRS